MLGAINRSAARTLLPLASLLMLDDEVLGFFFHIRGVARKPGGWRIPVFNMVMGLPLFAPLLLGVGGFLGIIASLLRREDDPPRERALLDGMVGFGYHLHGGLRNHPCSIKQPVHMVMYGSPLFAPLLYAATGFIGLLASLLWRAD